MLIYIYVHMITGIGIFFKMSYNELSWEFVQFKETYPDKLSLWSLMVLACIRL